MDLKKKIKGFFTLTRKANGGFTLVELIVVIAILAILAGVAVPAYNGYIKKADRSADDALLNEINTAFASACMANGESNIGREDVDAAINASNVFEYKEPFKTEFDKFFESKDQAFKVFEGLFYDPALGMFGVDEVLSFAFGDKLINLSSKDVAILSGDNAFRDRGSDALLTDVGTLQNLIGTGAVGDDILGAVTTSDDFMLAAGSYLNMKRDDYEDMDAYREAVGTKLDETNDTAVTNALIMYAASHAANMSDAQIEALFAPGTAVTSKIEDKNGNHATTMANAAIAYGMYTAYAQKNNIVIDETDPSQFTNTVNSSEFVAYVTSADGKADLEAYRAAMNMISDNTDNPEITGDILKNGISGNTALADLMKSVMGN